MTNFRAITFNTAVGNKKIKTEQRAFLELPFYREIIEGADSAPILALQEVGPAQAKALAQAAEGGAFTVIHISRPGQGNALLVPARFTVLRRRARFFMWSHLRAYAAAVARSIRTRKRLPSQYRERRMWIEARLRDEVTGRELTVYNTHLTLDGPLRVAMATSLFKRAHRARARGPVLLAGDLNASAIDSAKNPADARVRALFAPLQDMAATALDPRRPPIDWLLASGLESVGCRLYTDGALSLPGVASAELLSDHYAKEATLRFAA